MIINSSTIHIRQSHNVTRAGKLQFAHTVFPCKLGAAGIRPGKKEGDNATPNGTYPLLYGYYRPDRISKPTAKLPLIPLSPDDGWCDDVSSPNYNRPVKLPDRWHHEKLWRDDGLYDICLVLSHNLHPRKQNRGSAIFFHLTGTDFKPTQGCIAVDMAVMLRLLRRMDQNTTIIIHP